MIDFISNSVEFIKINVYIYLKLCLGGNSLYNNFDFINSIDDDALMFLITSPISLLGIE